MLPTVREIVQRPRQAELVLRSCREADAGAMLAIINTAAQAYREVIELDCWRDPYMTVSELRAEVGAGVRFIGCEIEGALVGVMGIQRILDVDLIRHAYVMPPHQGDGIGAAMLSRLCSGHPGPILVGTWAAAEWAIAFYRRHDFHLVSDESTSTLLKSYWTISDRQIQMSVVLAWPALSPRSAARLVDQAAQARGSALGLGR